MNDDITTYSLPPGWEFALIKDLIGKNGAFVDGDWIESKDQNSQGKIRLIQLADIGDGFFRNRSNRFMTREKAIDLNCTFLSQGDILVARMPNPLGRCCIFPLSQDESYVTVVDVAIIRTGENGILNKYLMHCLNSPFLRKEIESFQTGTTRKRISRGNLAKIKIPIPPLAEQYGIVARIEELFSELEHAQKTLLKTQQQLKISRHLFLKRAFEGAFTVKWRKENETDNPKDLIKHIKDVKASHYDQRVKSWQMEIGKWERKGKKGKKPAKPASLKNIASLSKEQMKTLPSIPSSWKWVKINEITLGVEYGSSIKSNRRGKIPVLRMGNIQNCVFDWDDLVFSSNQNEITKYFLRNGDVLFNRTNSPELVGKSAIYQGERQAIFAGYLIRINQFSEVVNPKYLNYFLNSPFAKEYGKKVKADAVNQSNINGTKLLNYPFPICSILEQDKIVEEIEYRFTMIDHLEKTIASNLEKVEIFRKAILQKAITGKLTGPVPEEATAKELLDQIKRLREEEFLEERPNRKSLESKKSKMKELSIIEILENSKYPVSAKEVWQLSKHKNDIEEFYAALKQVEADIIEIKTDIDSQLTLKNEN